LEENRTAAPAFGLESRPTIREWSLEDFLKHHPVKFDGRVSQYVADQWLKDIERIFNVKMCSTENQLSFAVYMLTSEMEHWWI